MIVRVAMSLVVLGATSLLVQVSLLRELLAAFYGNELFLGWVLGAWLLAVAAGALATRGPAARAPRPFAALGWGHAALTLLPPLTFALVRAARAALEPTPGAAPDILPAMGAAALLPLPLCLALGAQFSLALRAAAAAGAAERAPGWAYAVETAGLVAGGLIHAVFLAGRPDFAVLAPSAMVNAAAAALFLRAPGGRGPATAAALVALPVCLASGWADRMTAAWLYRGQDVLESFSSPCGTVTVTAGGGQTNYFQNGLFAGMGEGGLEEEFQVHLPLLAHPAPRRILLIGGGAKGAVAEVLRHRPERVDYVEWDPALADAIERHAPGLRDDPRVAIHRLDAVRFLRQTPPDAYDVILAGAPGPTTLLLNRLYTEDFFRLICRALRPEGVFGFHTPFSPDYVGPELAAAAGSVWRALTRVFPRADLYPEYSAIFVASESSQPMPAAAELWRRATARGVVFRFLGERQLAERLGTDRRGQALAAMQASGAPANRDRHPAACVLHLAWWMSAYHPGLARGTRAMATHATTWLAPAAVLLALGLGLLCRRRGPAAAGWAMGAGGFTLMALEVLLLAAYQSMVGHLYHRLALLLAAVLAGMAAGSWAGRAAARPPPRILAATHGVLALLAVLLPAAWGGADLLVARAPALATGGFLVAALALGAVVGYEFPAAVRLAGGPGAAGAIYAADLAGSCAGSVLAALVLFPMAGLTGTAAALAAVNAAVALGLWRRAGQGG